VRVCVYVCVCVFVWCGVQPLREKRAKRRSSGVIHPKQTTEAALAFANRMLSPPRKIIFSDADYQKSPQTQQPPQQQQQLQQQQQHPQHVHYQEEQKKQQSLITESQQRTRRGTNPQHSSILPTRACTRV